MTIEGTFKDKHLFCLKSTGLGVSEFFLRLMACLCVKDDSYCNSQMVIITGPNLSLAIKLISRLKAIFEPKLGIIFQNKETVCRFERQFLSKVDVTKGSIERTIVSMVRLKAPDILGQEKNKTKVPERKEFIYYQERWEGLNWRNVPLNPVAEHIEGRYIKQFVKPHINQQNGEMEYMELDVGKAQTIYYLPFSKKLVDDIIAKSAHSDKYTIKFTIKFASEDCPWGNRMATRDQFTYEQFANWKWDDIYRWHTKPTVKAAMDFQDKTKSGYNLTYELS
jgi:hypothetical protein